MSEFDTLIIGAGSAGAVLAARLSEAPDHAVLLMDAGADHGGEGTMPPDLLDSRNLASLDHDWGYEASPVAGRRIPYRRGRVFGGTSAINAAAALWGHPADFAEWADLGNTEWRWESVEPRFRRIESDPEGAAHRHGRNGPIPITRYQASELIPIQKAFYLACQSSGLPAVADHNAVGSAGVGPWPLNRRGRTRVSTALSHLWPARGRSNLALRANCLVNRLLIDGTRVTGVELAGGRTEIVRGRRVIVSAGAIGTPAILMRSGIGPKRDIEGLAIPLRLGREGVGARLWDHAAVPIRLVPKPGECVIGRDPRFQIMARFTAPRSRMADDMMLVLVTHLDLESMPARRAEAGVSTVAVLLVALMKPLGHGHLRLLSRDPEAAPEIDLGFCTEAEDNRRLAEGVRLAWKILGSAEMCSAFERVAGLDDDIVRSDDRLLAYMKGNVGTFCHALGTVPMGPERDPYAVVDQHCRVRGLENLWVVDASIFPTVPRVVPNLSVIMLADRVADWLTEAATST